MFSKINHDNSHYSMLAHRVRRWPRLEPTMVEHLMLTGRLLLKGLTLEALNFFYENLGGQRVLINLKSS